MEMTNNSAATFQYSVKRNEVYTSQPKPTRAHNLTGKHSFTCCCFCCKFEGGYPFEIVNNEYEGRETKYVTCLNCRNVVHTDRLFISSKNTHLLAGFLTPICCCFLPYYCNIFQHVKHLCPICKRYLGFSK